MSHRDISWDHFTIIFFGTPGEDLRVRGQVAVQEHGLQHLGGEGPWQTMADGNPTGADVWHPKHETVMVKKNRGKWTI
jgi:hypothetical protein